MLKLYPVLRRKASKRLERFSGAIILVEVESSWYT